jgi:hypothetical protein
MSRSTTPKHACDTRTMVDRSTWPTNPLHPRNLLIGWGLFFLAVAGPRPLRIVLGAPTSQNWRVRAGEALFQALVGFALREWAVRSGEWLAREREQLRDRLGREPTPEEIFQHRRHGTPAIGS